MLTSTAVDPDVFGLGGDGGIPSKGNIVLTYPLAASSSVSEGDWIKFSDTTNGYIQKCTDTEDNAIGVAFSSEDNTYGTDGSTAGVAGAKYAAVLRKGFAYVDGISKSSGTVAGSGIDMDSLLYLVVTSAGYPYGAQGVTATDGGVQVAIAMDSIAEPTDTGITIARLRVYLDRLNKAMNALET